MADRAHPSPVLDRGSWEQLVASWPDPVLVYDSEQRQYVVVNDAAVRLLGYSREEMLRLQPTDISHPDDAREIPSVIDQVERDGSVRRPWRGLRKDGTVISMEMTLTRRRIDGRYVSQGIFRVLDDGAPAAHTATGRPADVSAEQRLKLLERTSLAVVMLDRDGVVTYWNAGAAELWGRPAREAIGRPVLELAPTPDDRAFVETLLGQHEQRDEWVSRVTVRPPDGEPYEALITASADRTEEGELNGFLFVTAPLESPVRSTSPRMRRARVQCAACGREVAGTMRRKYCSEKCRQWAYYHRHLDAQRARSRQRHERRRNETGENGPDEQPPSDSDGVSGS
jgi:PAS domain S-box-containing protein